MATLLFLALWVAFHPKPHVDRYWSQQQRLVFEFDSAESETKSAQVSFVLGEKDLRNAESAVVRLTYRFELLERYPDTATGEVACATRIVINGSELGVEHRTYTFRGAGPDQWNSGPDYVEGYTSETIYPSIAGEEQILDRLDQSGDNSIQATTTCTSRISATGPTIALITFGPLECFVTT